MNPGHPFDLAALLDDLNADRDPFFLLVLGPLQAPDHLVGDIQPRHEILHVTGHPQGTGRGHPGQNKEFFIKAEIANRRHEFGEPLHVVDNLGLDEIASVARLLGQAGGPGGLVRSGEGVGGATQEEAGFMALDRLAALELFSVPHLAHHPQQLDGVHIEDPLGAGMVAELLVIAGKAEQIFQPQGRGPQDIALHPDPIAVAAGHLDNRLHPFRLGKESGSDTGHPHNGGLAVGDIDRINLALKQTRLLPHHFRVAALGRP